MTDQKVSASLHCSERGGITVEYAGPNYLKEVWYEITVDDGSSQAVLVKLTITEMHMLLSILSAALPREAA